MITYEVQNYIISENNDLINITLDLSKLYKGIKPYIDNLNIKKDDKAFFISFYIEIVITNLILDRLYIPTDDDIETMFIDELMEYTKYLSYDSLVNFYTNTINIAINECMRLSNDIKNVMIEYSIPTKKIDEFHLEKIILDNEMSNEVIGMFKMSIFV